MVPGAAGHMGPALQGIFVGQGPRALPGVRYKPGRATARVAPTEACKGCVGEGLCSSRRAGKSAKRRRWRMQRAGFEEVPRLADTTVAGNRLARRWAREPRPYEFFAIQIFAKKRDAGEGIPFELFTPGPLPWRGFAIIRSPGASTAWPPG